MYVEQGGALLVADDPRNESSSISAQVLEKFQMTFGEAIPRCEFDVECQERPLRLWNCLSVVDREAASEEATTLFARSVGKGRIVVFGKSSVLSSSQLGGMRGVGLPQSIAEQEQSNHG